MGKMSDPAELAAPVAGWYLRIEAAEPRQPGARPGLFQLLRGLRESGHLSDDDARTARRLVSRAYQLHAEPPAAAYEAPTAKAWFRMGAGDEVQLRTLWEDVVALLDRHGVPTRTVRTDDPGLLVYADAVQVVAVAVTDRDGQAVTRAHRDD
jgi:hypothetical protein